MATKECKDCGVTKPLDDFGRDRTRVDGRRYECKPCAVQRTRDWQQRNAAHVAAYNRAYWKAHPEKLREHNRLNRERHGDAIRAQQKEYYWRNRQRRVAYNRDWYHKNKDARREAERQRLREHYRANRDAYRERHRKAYLANREAFLESSRRYYKRVYAEDPEKARGRVRAYRARKLGAPGEASPSAVRARWDYYGGRCWMCGEVATSIDHVIPLSRGGSDWPANLRPACGSCNSRKHTLLPREMALR